MKSSNDDFFFNNDFFKLVLMICGLCWFATAATTTIPHVMVNARVGKEFPDVRQNEREIKFIRVGDAVRTAGQLRGEPALNKGP